MLFLISSWSHNQDRKKILEKAIFHLERGKENQKQLKSLYAYMNKRYGKVYTQTYVDDLKLKNDILLKRNIELEKKQESLNLDQRDDFESLTTKKETPEQMLERAKKHKKKKRNSLRID